MDTKKQLLLAAQALFVQKGFNAVSTREIAEFAEVNLAAIQYHYGSKENLFIASVKALWCDRGDSLTREILNTEANTVQDAVSVFGKFVASFVVELLYPDGPQPCRVMFRELFAENCSESQMCKELINTIVEEFIEPMDSRLLRIIAILKPNSTDDERQRIGNALIGQCFFYMTHEPFLKELRSVDYYDRVGLKDTISFITRFTLQACEIDNNTIEHGVTQAVDFYNSELISKVEAND